MSFENVRALKKELTDLRTAALYSKGRAEAAEKELAECRAALDEAEKKACRHVHLSSGKEDPDTVDLRAELAEVTRERDLAIAHDRQPYPTAEAYERVCIVSAGAKARVEELCASLNQARENDERHIQQRDEARAELAAALARERVKYERDLEAIADECHRQWSGWTSHVFSKMVPLNGGAWLSLTWMERWQKQIDTPYAELSEPEKESDRREARKIIAALSQPAKTGEQK